MRCLGSTATTSFTDAFEVVTQAQFYDFETQFVCDFHGYDAGAGLRREDFLRHLQFRGRRPGAVARQGIDQRFVHPEYLEGCVILENGAEQAKIRAEFAIWCGT